MFIILNKSDFEDFFRNDRRVHRFIICQNYMMFPLVLYPPPPILRLCIVLFVVAEGWLLLDIGWFVLFFIDAISNVILSSKENNVM